MLKEQVEQNGMGRYLASIRALEQDRPELAYDERFYDIAYRAVHELSLIHIYLMRSLAQTSL